jgi:hypothetical protein
MHANILIWISVWYKLETEHRNEFSFIIVCLVVETRVVSFLKWPSGNKCYFRFVCVCVCVC